MNRRGFIGGSDARRIMEGDWYNLWHEKTGRKEPADLSDNLAVQLGVATESFHIGWFERNYFKNSFEQASIGLREQVEFKDTLHGVPCKGTVDAIFTSRDNILECKHTYDRNTMESCIKQYMPQLQFYMMLSGAESCYLSVIFGNRRWECVKVSHDSDYIDRMMVSIREFWGLVEMDKEPFRDEKPATLNTDHILVDNMTRRDATSDNEFISRCHDYIEQEANAKLFESAKADLKAMVGDTEREVYCDLLTIKRDKRGALRITIKENK